MTDNSGDLKSLFSLLQNELNECYRFVKYRIINACPIICEHIKFVCIKTTKYLVLQWTCLWNLSEHFKFVSPSISPILEWRISPVLVCLSNKNPKPNIGANAERYERERSKSQPTFTLLTSQPKRGSNYGPLQLYIPLSYHFLSVYTDPQASMVN